LVLLGSSHYKQFNDFATDEAIIMTEVYEYACSLNDEKFSINEFQVNITIKSKYFIKKLNLLIRFSAI